MHIEDCLSLLALAKDFKVTACGDNCFIVEDEDHNFRALYQEGEWRYFVTGVYNSDRDSVEINLGEFKNLVEFTEHLGSEVRACGSCAFYQPAGYGTAECAKEGGKVGMYDPACAFYEPSWGCE